MAWKHFVCEIAVRPAQVLIDDRFSSSAPVDALPLVTWIGVYCRMAPCGGFWDPAETEALDNIEDDLIRTVSGLTTGGMQDT